MTRSAALLESRSAFALLVAIWLLFWPSGAALAQQPPAPRRDVKFEWDAQRKNLYVDLSFRDVVDAEIQKKLSRGLPTTIIFSATLYRVGSSAPLATTAQSCKITWHVWEEYYIIERTRPEGSEIRPALSTPDAPPEGVLRRCAEVKVLPTGTSDHVPIGASVYLVAKVQVNPLSPELLDKIKRWVSRPSGTGTAAPGDALFSTFTGLFLQRMGDAERDLKFTTKATVPTVRKPPKRR